MAHCKHCKQDIRLGGEPHRCAEGDAVANGHRNARRSAAACSLLERLEQLAEQWERRTIAADKLANDYAGAGDWTEKLRCQTKAGVIRSMTVELKRVIREANA